MRGSSFSTHMTGPRVAVFVAYMVAAVALLWRRSGLSATLVLAAALAGEWLVFGSPEGFGVFALLVVAGYSVGAHEDRPRSLYGLAALAGCGAVWLLRDPATGTWSSVVGASVWLSPVLIAWLLGAYLRTRRQFVAALRDRADRAESEREILAENAVVQERARIARELHDIVAHSVSVMVVQAEAADEMLDRQRSDRARIPISKIQDTGRSALTDMRRMLGVLREADSPLLAPQPGIANLDLLLAEVRDSGLPVELEVSGEPTPLSPGIELSAFRIVQEALTNALKYAGPPTHGFVCGMATTCSNSKSATTASGRQPFRPVATVSLVCGSASRCLVANSRPGGCLPAGSSFAPGCR